MGLDLLDWFRGRHPWGKLLRLAAGLPAHSRYKAAAVDDDDIAEAIADREPDTTELRMTTAGWTPERSLLTCLVDAVGYLTAVTIAVNSRNGKVPEVPRLPRPVTALERHHERQVQAVREMVLDQLLPGRDPHPDTSSGGVNSGLQIG